LGNTKIIQSLDRALSILELFKLRPKELSVTEISNELQLSKSTAFGLINTLAARGYLHQNPNTQKYSLGMSLLALGEIVHKNQIITEKAKPYLEKLVEMFNETVHLAIGEGESVIYIDKIEGNKTIFINSRIGFKNPMYSTGVGKCLLAYSDREKRNDIISRMQNMIAYTENTITDKRRLAEELDLVKKQGYAVDNEEFEKGLYCLAVPILDKFGQSIAAISVSGPTATMKNYDIHQVVDEMKSTASQITKELKQ